nr:MAG TPA: hypothetical protein [Caudoviricetes sp.]
MTGRFELPKHKQKHVTSKTSIKIVFKIMQ